MQLADVRGPVVVAGPDGGDTAEGRLARVREAGDRARGAARWRGAVFDCDRRTPGGGPAAREGSRVGGRGEAVGERVHAASESAPLPADRVQVDPHVDPGSGARRADNHRLRILVLGLERPTERAML